MRPAPAQLGGGPVVAGPVLPGPVDELANPVDSGSKVVPDDPGRIMVVEEGPSDELLALPLSDSPDAVVELVDSGGGVDGGSEKQANVSRTPSIETTERQTILLV